MKVAFSKLRLAGAEALRFHLEALFSTQPGRKLNHR